MSAGKQGLAVAGCNYVGQDQIWKDHVHQEETASKKWPENWGFMTQRYDDLVKNELPQKVRGEIKAPTPTRPPAVTPLEDRVHVEPSPKPVPVRSSGFYGENKSMTEIGWRSTSKECQLEIYGRYAKPKGGLVKQLKWPNEAIN